MTKYNDYGQSYSDSNVVIVVIMSVHVHLRCATVWSRL